MASAQEIVFRLTQQTTLSAPDRRKSLRDFAEETGWCPSDELEDYPGTERFANGHLVVEHGMANTAVITFLKPDCDFGRLEGREKLGLLELSYNNLVDWHLLPDMHGLTVVYNRTDPATTTRFEDRECWRVEAFERVTSQHAKPELKALDDAFVSTISHWKRAIGGELGKKVTNSNLSGLFNTLILIRALEDHRRHFHRCDDRLLLSTIAHEPGLSIGECCRRALRKLGKHAFPAVIQQQEQDLAVFDGLPLDLVQELLLDFYKNRFCPYRYDFSLISKHALSHIYEHYVSVLRTPETDQGGRLFPDLAEEVSNKELGCYYTPQYIARFFGRYLQEHTTPRDFREMKIADPACGSGIFLRTALELRSNPLDPLNTKESIKSSFQTILGLDRESSACEAARLSLSLLHLVLTDSFPKSLNVCRQDAVEFVQGNKKDLGTYDAVITNPPYISWDLQRPAWRKRVAQYLGKLSRGKVDVYVALLKAGLDLVRPGGFAMYVLPHTFLYAQNSSGLRHLIVEECWVRLVADLSDLKVFEDVSSYTILLILQKATSQNPAPAATVVKCRSAVGEALSAALRGRTADNEFYRVFDCPQSVFRDDTWKLLPPKQQSFLDRLSKLPQLSQLTTVGQGIVTGSDDVFMRQCSEMPVSEKGVWRLLLSDREMVPYTVPNKTERCVFYPFDGTQMLEPDNLTQRYPHTWKLLNNCRKELSGRRAVSSGEVPWWRPERLRDPRQLFSPKIVSPHLMLTPRFGLDSTGKYAVSHGPFIVANDETSSWGMDFLKYLVAVLNSSVGFWQITVQSHKYGRQYAMVEVKTLKTFRVPDPRSIPQKVMQRLVTLVTQRMEHGYSPETELAIDDLVAEIYGVTQDDLKALGIS